MLDVSVIIVNYNTSLLMRDCINSIRKYTKGVSYEVIVVDNNSDKEQKLILNQIHANNIKVIELDENIGFGRANNIGLKTAVGNNIFFLNPDTVLLSNAIKILNDFLLSNPDCGACGGNLYDMNLEPIHSHNINFPGFTDELDQALQRKLTRIINGKSTLHNFKTYPIKVSFVTGADLMVRKSLLDDIGGFNDKFFMYFEDTELQYRIKEKGLLIYNVPSAKIIHLEGKSFIHSRKREYMILKSREKYYYLTHSKFYCWCISKFYYIINYIGYIVSSLQNNQQMRQKLIQRLSILKEINDNG